MEKIKTVLLDFGNTLIRERSTVRDNSGRAVCAQMMPGASEVIRAIRQRGLKIILVANGNSRDIRKLLADTRMETSFDAILISEETGYEKPRPEIFEMALDIAGTSASETVMVGNRASQDVAGANGLGIHPVWFKWDDGYRDEPEGPLSTPEFTITSLSELPGILDRYKK